MPKPLVTVRPLFLLELQAARTGGDVTLRFIVGTDGQVSSCEVLKSDHPGLSAAAAEAVQQWRFQPGIKAGKPVATPMQITIPFRGAK